MSLMSSLGLEKIESDPNKLPDGKYDGIIEKDEYVVFPKKNTYNHVITLKVDPNAKVGRGARPQKVFTLGKDPKFDEAGNLTALQVDGVMSDDNKKWYKLFLEQVGVDTDEKQANFKVGSLANTPVTFGSKKNNEGYTNVTFIQKRTPAATQVVVNTESEEAAPVVPPTEPASDDV